MLSICSNPPQESKAPITIMLIYMIIIRNSGRFQKLQLPSLDLGTLHCCMEIRTTLNVTSCKDLGMHSDTVRYWKGWWAVFNRKCPTFLWEPSFINQQVVKDMTDCKRNSTWYEAVFQIGKSGFKLFVTIHDQRWFPLVIALFTYWQWTSCT